ncbi:MAG: hypothetical protein PHR52_05340 [Fermentimonas sp.]|nr:hypothetical protein [Fermentimonas sp.]MDD4696940.1 hypothetical protein [Fermentimonas sp.]
MRFEIHNQFPIEGQKFEKTGSVNVYADEIKINEDGSIVFYSAEKIVGYAPKGLTVTGYSI